MNPGISEKERQRRARQRAFSIRQFSEIYNIGRTKIYGEFKSGRLRGRKIGKHTIILEDDAEDWLRRLPAIEPEVRIMNEAEKILHAHGIKLRIPRPDGQYYTTCPQCSAKRSKKHQKSKVLGVLVEPGDKVLWHCNHCGWSGPPKGSGGGRPELPSYVYRDSAGVPRFRKVRNQPGRQPRFWLEQPDGKGGWKKGVKGVDTTILYRVDEIREAIDAGRVICVVEGEKDADNLRQLGIPATCNAHGAASVEQKKYTPKWYKSHTAQLRGADIVVLNDNDAPGYAHAETASKLSLDVAKRVRRLDLKLHWPEMPEGKDVSDWLQLGGAHTPERLKELIASAPDCARAEKSADNAGEAPANGGDESINDDAELERLARLSAIEYGRARRAAAKVFGGVPVKFLDAAVAAKRAELGLDAQDGGRQGKPAAFAEPEPWPEPVDGTKLLDQLAATIRSYIVMPDSSRDAIAVWTVHSYLLDRTPISPRLAIRSPTMQCGKTTLIDVLAHLVLKLTASRRAHCFASSLDINRRC